MRIEKNNKVKKYKGMPKNDVRVANKLNYLGRYIIPKPTKTDDWREQD